MQRSYIFSQGNLWIYPGEEFRVIFLCDYIPKRNYPQFRSRDILIYHPAIIYNINSQPMDERLLNFYQLLTLIIPAPARLIRGRSRTDLTLILPAPDKANRADSA